MSTSTIFELLYPISALFQLLLAGVAVYAGMGLRGLCKTKAALLIIASGILFILASLEALLSFALQYLIPFESIQWLWISLNLITLVAFALLIFGLLLLAKEFQAFIKEKRFHEQIQQDLDSQ